jgi:hypothetical protein
LLNREQLGVDCPVIVANDWDQSSKQRQQHKTMLLNIPHSFVFRLTMNVELEKEHAVTATRTKKVLESIGFSAWAASVVT